jgi:hypothetical protein
MAKGKAKLRDKQLSAQRFPPLFGKYMGYSERKIPWTLRKEADMDTKTGKKAIYFKETSNHGYSTLFSDFSDNA